MADNGQLKKKRERQMLTLRRPMLHCCVLIGLMFCSLGAIAQEGQDANEPVATVAAPESPLVKSLPDWLKGSGHEFLTVEYYQWIGLFVIILAGVVLDYTIRFFLRGVSKRLIKRQGAMGEHAEAIRLAARPVGLLCAAIVWFWLLQGLGLAETAERVLQGAVRVFGVLAGIWAAWRITDLVSDVLIDKAADTQNKFDDVLIPLVRKTVKVFIIAIGLVYAADSLRIQLMPLLASLGIGGVAFAFAAKDTVENFFGSVAVLIDRPFEVGDWVVIGEHEGTVEEVGFRSTRVRTFYNSQITVPNSNLVRAIVDNYGRREYRRWKTYIGVQYDTPPDKLVAFTEGIRELVRTHPYTRKDYFQVYLNRFGPSSLDILLYIFHAVPDWSTELRERERMFLDIVRLADQLGVQFAFPTQTVHLYREEHGPAEPQSAIPGQATDREAGIAGIHAARSLVADQSWQTEKPGAVEFREGPTPLGGQSDDTDG